MHYCRLLLTLFKVWPYSQVPLVLALHASSARSLKLPIVMSPSLLVKLRFTNDIPGFVVWITLEWSDSNPFWTGELLVFGAFRTMTVCGVSTLCRPDKSPVHVPETCAMIIIVQLFEVSTSSWAGLEILASLDVQLATNKWYHFFRSKFYWSRASCENRWIDVFVSTKTHHAAK